MEQKNQSVRERRRSSQNDLLRTMRSLSISDYNPQGPLQQSSSFQGGINIGGGIGAIGNNFHGPSTLNFRLAEDRDPAEIAAARREAAIDALRVNDQGLREAKLLDETYKGTCDWIFDSQNTKFNEWLESGDNVFCIYGKPGSGKSCLMSHIATSENSRQHLSVWTEGEPLFILTHFFFLHGSREQNSVLGLARNLLYQVLIQKPELADGIDVVMHQRPSLWSPSRLLESLHAAIQATGRPYFLLIDALDELRDESEQDTLFDFVRDLSSLNNVKLCISARPDMVFLHAFEKYSSVYVQDHTRTDFENTVIGKFQGSEKRWDSYLRKYDTKASQFVKDTVEKADGVYLWLHFAVQELLKGVKRKDSLEILESRLLNMSSSLDELYEDLMSRADATYGEITSCVIGYFLGCTERGRSELPLVEIAAATHECGLLEIMRIELEKAPLSSMQIHACFDELLDFFEKLHDYSAGFLECKESLSVSGIDKAVRNDADKQSVDDDDEEDDSGETDDIFFIEEDDSSEDDGCDSPERTDMQLRRLLRRFRDFEVTFIHRTCGDFLQRRKGFVRFPNDPDQQIAAFVPFLLTTKMLQQFLIHQSGPCRNEEPSKNSSRGSKAATLMLEAFLLALGKLLGVTLDLEDETNQRRSADVYAGMLSLLSCAYNLTGSAWTRVCSQHSQNCLGECAFPNIRRSQDIEVYRAWVHLLQVSEKTQMKTDLVELCVSVNNVFGSSFNPLRIAEFLVDRIHDGIPLRRFYGSMERTIGQDQFSDWARERLWFNTLIAVHLTLGEHDQLGSHSGMDSFFLHSKLCHEPFPLNSLILSPGPYFHISPLFAYQFVLPEAHPFNHSRELMCLGGAKAMCFLGRRKRRSDRRLILRLEVTTVEIVQIKELILNQVRRLLNSSANHMNLKVPISTPTSHDNEYYQEKLESLINRMQTLAPPADNALEAGTAEIEQADSTQSASEPDRKVLHGIIEDGEWRIYLCRNAEEWRNL